MLIPKDRKIIKVQHVSKKMNDYIRIEWNIGKRCNFDCSYCNEETHDNFSPHVPIKIVERLFNKIVDWKQNEKINFNISGGEPFVHPNIIEIAKMMYDLKFEWKTINTNGSLPIKKYMSSVSYFDHFIFSWHLEYTKETHMKNLLLELKKNNVSFRCILMFLPGQIKKIKQIKDFLDENNIDNIVKKINPIFKNNKLQYPKINPIDENRFFNTNDNNLESYYSKEELNWLSEIDKKQNQFLKNLKITLDDNSEIIINSTVFSNQKLNNFFGWKCMIGKKRLVIHANGDIYKGVCKQDGLIGNIFDDNLQFPNDGTICNFNICMCNGEIPILKWKI